MTWGKVGEKEQHEKEKENCFLYLEKKGQGDHIMLVVAGKKNIFVREKKVKIF